MTNKAVFFGGLFGSAVTELKIKKIILWASVAICGFVLVTFVFTFLGIDLPWTAHRASAVMIPQGVRTYEYTGYEENGIFIKEEQCIKYIKIGDNIKRKVKIGENIWLILKNFLTD